MKLSSALFRGSSNFLLPLLVSPRLVSPASFVRIFSQRGYIRGGIFVARRLTSSHDHRRIICVAGRGGKEEEEEEEDEEEARPPATFRERMVYRFDI